jgi:hypothetical protein
MVISSTPWSRRSKRSRSYSAIAMDCPSSSAHREAAADADGLAGDKDASSEARNATTLATSAGWPSRRNGIALVRASRSFGPANDANSAVSVGPGTRNPPGQNPSADGCLSLQLAAAFLTQPVDAERFRICSARSDQFNPAAKGIR